MNKRIISCLMASAFALSLAACADERQVGRVGGTEQNTNSDESGEVSSTADVSDEISDDVAGGGSDVPSSDGLDYEIEEGAAVITKYSGDSSVVEVPREFEGSPVTKIGPYAFEACYGVTEVMLPDTLTIIGEGAFMDCGDLEKINIPETVTGIDRGAFVSCTSLASLEIPENVEYIREEAFTACEALTSLTIENPGLAYENWGLEDLPDVTVYSQSGSTVSEWASEMGKFSAQ